jgi:uncharacterized protein
MKPIRIDVHVQPRASHTELAGLHDGRIRIRIAAAATDNAANVALVEFIAERLGIARRNVRIAAGATGRRKVVQIDGVTQATIEARLGVKAAAGD